MAQPNLKCQIFRSSYLRLLPTHSQSHPFRFLKTLLISPQLPSIVEKGVTDGIERIGMGRKKREVIEMSRLAYRWNPGSSSVLDDRREGERELENEEGRRVGEKVLVVLDGEEGEGKGKREKKKIKKERGDGLDLGEEGVKKKRKKERREEVGMGDEREKKKSKKK